ncbi:phage portal protein [Virgibacillus salexigens]|uniref:phage portal protein n=1 Tax=Virgibacillus salexigens TaxID=61016 RepID=UPI00190947D1|nr:phage portal protein [Virgibacillus salexigens]
MILGNLFKGNKTNQQFQQARMLDGYSPIFSQFGQNVYSSDVVQMCIDVIATECSKLKPKHLRIDSEGMHKTVNSSMNRLFKFSPNELMTTRDFIEKIIWQLYLNFNAFIYPMYEIKTNARGEKYREYTGFYPLNPTVVTFLQDQKQDIFLELQFANGTKFTLAYADVIHLRKKFSVNDVMGGGKDGQPDNEALLKVLTINDSVLQGLDKAIKTSLSVRGIININTMMDDEAQKAERKKFESAIASGQTGIMAMDLKGDYVDIKPNPKIVDKDTLEFLQNKILNFYGVSVPILTGDYNDEQYQAFYEKTLEPLVISLGQAFSKTMFSQRELDFGNEIVFYQKDMMYLSTKAKLDLLKTAGEQGLLTDNQKLALLGYPPIRDGDKRTMSLNYIDVELANAYQMGRKNTTNGGGNGDE